MFFIFFFFFYFFFLFFFFFNDTAPTEIYTLSLHDALPISRLPAGLQAGDARHAGAGGAGRQDGRERLLLHSARQSAALPVPGGLAAPAAAGCPARRHASNGPLRHR